ncbi:hypothetical protein BDV93DRAFT_517017 [Ceratobasidium sp. AG-I]|nr:hypothetical protein BDV93DRAFT_517017 [Ceratobasidium sp. AG-I]
MSLYMFVGTKQRLCSLPFDFYVEIAEPLASQEGCYSRGNKTPLLVQTAVKRCVIPPWWLISRRTKSDGTTNSALSFPNPNIVAFRERHFRKGGEELNFHAKNEHPQYSDLNSSRRCVCTILASSKTSSTTPGSPTQMDPHMTHLTPIAGFFGYAMLRRDDTGEPHAMTHMHAGLHCASAYGGRTGIDFLLRHVSVLLCWCKLVVRTGEP